MAEWARKWLKNARISVIFVPGLQYFSDCVRLDSAATDALPGQASQAEVFRQAIQHPCPPPAKTAQRTLVGRRRSFVRLAQ